MPLGNPKARVGAALIVLGAILGGCGSDEGGEDAEAPVLPGATAERLAAQSDEIADTLERGDVCGAADQADALSLAISEEEIPEDLRPEVEAATEQLVNQVNCPEPVEGKKEDKDEEKEEKDEEEGRGEEERGPQGEGDGGGAGSGGSGPG